MNQQIKQGTRKITKGMRLRFKRFLPKRSPKRFDVCEARPLRSVPNEVRNSAVVWETLELVESVELERTRLGG